MSTESRTPFRPTLQLRDECERLGCTNKHTEPVRLEGDTATRRLCRPCKKEHFGVSS